MNHVFDEQYIPHNPDERTSHYFANACNNPSAICDYCQATPDLSTGKTLPVCQILGSMGD